VVSPVQVNEFPCFKNSFANPAKSVVRGGIEAFQEPTCFGNQHEFELTERMFHVASGQNVVTSPSACSIRKGLSETCPSLLLFLDCFHREFDVLFQRSYGGEGDKNRAAVIRYAFQVL
jgi:hypothetical protein